MNILVVAHYHYQGICVPTALFVHNQMKEFVKAGHRVRILVPTPMIKTGQDGKRFFPLLYTEVVDGIEHVFMRFPSFSNYGKRTGWNLRSAVWVLNRNLSKILGDFRPDIIHAHKLGINTELASLLRQRFGCPLVFTSHGETGCEAPWNHDLNAVKRYADKADTVVCVSSAIKRYLEQAGVSPELRVICNGFAVNHCLPSADRRPFSVIQVGHLTKQKRINVTIESFRQLRKQYPDAALTLAGEGTERRALEQQCETGHLGDAVWFTGEIPNEQVMELLSRSQFFVMPSVNEGFGIVYLEAMASGCITIGTAGEGIADFIKDGVNGFLVPPDRPDVIAQRIAWCLEHPEEADRIARQGRQDAAEQTWEKNARDYLALFEEWKGKYNHDGKTEAGLEE